MASTASASIRLDLLGRRDRLQHTIDRVGPTSDLSRLLSEVDAALERIEHGTHGSCAVCDESMDEELGRHPLGRYCLCELSDSQMRALQADLDTASSIQLGLLPAPDLSAGGWLSHYRYVPAGPVSGDIVDVFARPDETLYFLLGDVAGKGVSAALLMAHLAARFRSLTDAALPLSELLGHVSEELRGRTGPGRYVTLVAGVATPDGRLEVANAGHVPPLLLSSRGVERIDATGFPAGLFSGAGYGVHARQLASGDAIVLYTDGIIESTDDAGIEYGIDGLTRNLSGASDLEATALGSTLLSAASAFRGGRPATDDQSLLILQRE